MSENPFNPFRVRRGIFVRILRAPGNQRRVSSCASDSTWRARKADAWFDEMHPTGAGFAALATKFRQQMRAKLEIKLG